MKDLTSKCFKELESICDIKKLSKNHIASFLWNIDSDCILQIKIIYQPPANYWSFRSKNYNGLYVLVFNDKTFISIHSKDINLTQCSTKSLRDKYINTDLTCQNLLMKLKLIDVSYYITKEILDKQLISTILDRNESISKAQKSMQLETLAHNQFKQILGSKFNLTPEGNLADWTYNHDDCNNLIPIQSKTCNIKTNSLSYIFYSCNKYNGMLLFCRPMPAIELGTMIIPGNFIKAANITITIKPNTKYYPFFVRDNELENFMQNIYIAIKQKKTTIKWPSQIEVDISSIYIRSTSFINNLMSKTCKVEHANQQLRYKMFTDLSINTPDNHGTTVDIIIEGVRIQDKTLSCRKDSQARQVVLSKSAGRKKNGSKCQPYEVGDFDAVWIFDKKQEYFGIIPSKILQCHGYLKTTECKGKMTLMCYDFSYDKNISRSKKIDLWTQNYFYKYNDVNCISKVKVLLTNIRKDLNLTP